MQTHRTRYIWFGTNRVFDAFTFIFRRNREGLFQVHAYPFDAHTSTFIVECQEETWRKAGLENADESESIAYCEELFGPELDGHRLLSNRSLWINFITLRCESWHHKNLVLVGDAAHTAHFSIGSGTKLAMEDSIALVDSLRRIPDLERALTDYEMTRQPVVERFQEAAAESSAYFENVARYEEFTPLQFAFNLLTRSRRITYLNLALRDPQLVASLDASMTSRSNGSRHYAPPPLFTSCYIGSTSLTSRLVLSDSSSRLPHLAGSGAGLLLTRMVAVSSDGRVDPEADRIYAAHDIERLKTVVKAVHERGEANIGLQLGHAGRRGSMRPPQEGVDRPLRSGGWQTIAPSAIPYAPWADSPRAMSRVDMDALLGAFDQATEAAHTCGFDLLELNFGQGYLLGSFLSPLSNQRPDVYGGTLSGRLAFPMEVFKAVRKRWAGPLAVRLLAGDMVDGGFTLEDALVVGEALKQAGCDLIHPVAGYTTPRSTPDYNRLYGATASDRIRNEIGIATLASGRITTLDEMNTLIGAGRADLCLLDQPPMS
jgi:anthraniloyl-CoA monooxygenase